MNKRQNLQLFTAIVLTAFTASLVTITATATFMNMTISVATGAIIYADHVKISPGKNAGNPVEPLNTVTCLPVRIIGEACGKAVDWGGPAPKGCIWASAAGISPVCG